MDIFTSQKEDVWDYMKRYGTITSAEGFLELGVKDLPKRISELRLQDGKKINRRWKRVKTRKGRISSVIVYSITPDGEDEKYTLISEQRKTKDEVSTAY